jgi:serine protease Do
MNLSKIRNGVLAVGAASCLALGYGLGAVHADASSTVAGAVSAAVAPAGTSAHLTLPDFSSIVTQYGPAVVNVRVSGVIKTADEGPQMPQFGGSDDPFRDFFRQFGQGQFGQGQFGHGMPQDQAPGREMHGLGSGFIISPDGLILTNAHVVANANEVTVKLTDKREFRARVLGVDRPTDIALLKIDARDLPVVKLGDASQARVGQWAVAIGAPFGFENTATAGIISAKARSLPDEGYVQFLQTDVPVNPGNSGGPLFDLDGRVIGINSQIYSGTGGYEGVSFAIPINTALQVEQQLLAHGKVERGQLGISVQSVDQSLAQAFGLDHATGALVSSVNPDGAGARAGLKSGDVILAFDGHTIADSADLPPLVAAVKPGDTATVSVWRQGARHELRVTVGETASTTASTSAPATDKARLGVAVRPLTPDERAQANVSSGLLVEQVSGPAAKAGIEAGDIVLALDGQPVSSVEQLRKLVANSGKHVALLVQHDDAKVFVPVDLG